MITHNFVLNSQAMKGSGGKLAKTSQTNQIASVVNGQSPNQHAGNIHQEKPRHGQFWGVVVRTGPNGDEGDYGDDRYWVQTAQCTNDQTDLADANFEITEIDQGGDGSEDTSLYDPRWRVVTASNLAESVSRGHFVPLGTPVRVTAIQDQGDPQTVRFVFNTGTAEIWMKITGASPVSGKTNLWSYQWTQQLYLRAGQWQDYPAGLTNGSAHYGGLAYNTVEAYNAATGIQGNSVDLAPLPSGFTIKAVRGTPIVRAIRQFSCDDPPVGEWLFQYENAVQGGCP